MTIEEWVKIHQDDPTEEFLKEAREKNFIRRLDSHAEIFSFIDGVYSIRFVGNPKSPPVWAHLIVGEDAALLIDTGYGVGDIKAAAESFIGGKPLTVVNTHVHGDHVSGNYRFPSVYTNELELDELYKLRTPETVENLKNSEWVLPDDDVVSYCEYEVIPYRGGKTFTLGKGHEVEMIELPGHTVGSCVALDHKNRILFSSDSILMKLERYFKGPGLDEIRALNARIGEFDYVFPGHCKLMLPPSVVTDTLNIIERISATPDSPDFRIDRFGKGSPVFVSGDIGLIYLTSRERRPPAGKTV